MTETFDTRPTNAKNRNDVGAVYYQRIKAVLPFIDTMQVQMNQKTPTGQDKFVMAASVFRRTLHKTKSHPNDRHSVFFRGQVTRVEGRSRLARKIPESRLGRPGKGLPDPPDIKKEIPGRLNVLHSFYSQKAQDGDESKNQCTVSFFSVHPKVRLPVGKTELRI